VDQFISTFESEPVGNPPQSIWQYEYKGQAVYFIPAQCCDQFSQLYAATGNLLCAPDGGFIGRGDGRCPDFFAFRSAETLIWQDPRSR
jgi:YHS domain-containing protein